MTRRVANFRRGDLSEGLGLNLLREVALVAPVPREEDVGLDAIATILSKDGRLLNAGSSFWVQIKSRGRGEGILLDPGRVRWLKQRRLPVFFGVVTRNPLRLDLFSTNQLDDVWGQPGVAEAFKKRGHEVSLSFEAAPLPRPLEKNILNVALGPPVVSLTADALDDADAAARVTQVLAAWVELEALNIQLKLLGIHLAVDDWNASVGPLSVRVRISGVLALRRADLVSGLAAIQALGRVAETARVKGDPQVREAVGIIDAWLAAQGVVLVDIAALALDPGSLDEGIL